MERVLCAGRFLFPRTCRTKSSNRVLFKSSWQCELQRPVLLRSRAHESFCLFSLFSLGAHTTCALQRKSSRAARQPINSEPALSKKAAVQFCVRCGLARTPRQFCATGSLRHSLCFCFFCVYVLGGSGTSSYSLPIMTQGGGEPV